MDFFNDKYSPCQMKDMKPSTIQNSRNYVRMFAKVLGREPLLSDFNKKTVSVNLEIIRSSYSVDTWRQCRGRLCDIWKMAHDLGLVRTPPKLRPILNESIDQRGWTVEQVAVLFEACRTTLGTIEGFPAGSWWHGLHLVLFASAEPLDPILKARWKQLSGDKLEIPAEHRKVNETITVRLHMQTVRDLEKIQRGPDQEMFPWSKSRATLHYHYRRILQRAGLGGASRFYKLQHAARNNKLELASRYRRFTV